MIRTYVPVVFDAGAGTAPMKCFMPAARYEE